jgi:RNA-binding protein YlmH
MINKQSFLKSILNTEEKMLFAKALDRAAVAEKTYTEGFSDFMDPYKAHKLCDAFKHDSLTAVCYGGFEESERMLVGFFPEYSVPDGSEMTAYYAMFPIRAVEIAYNARYSRTLTHRDFLGSVLGLGITREKTGDIMLEQSRAVMFVKDEIADFIVTNLERVGHTSVQTKVLNEYQPKIAESTEKKFTVPSLRLDAVISDAFNISRGKAADLIKGEKAFLNWQCEVSTSKQVAVGDVITLRGTGRVKITEIVGVTKKDRILINTIVYK